MKSDEFSMVQACTSSYVASENPGGSLTITIEVAKLQLERMFMLIRSLPTWLLLFSAICYSNSLNAVLAQNTYFLPGDAFFPTEMTADDAKQLQYNPDKPNTFQYSSFEGWPEIFMRLNAGYPQVTIPSLDEKFITNLKKAYQLVRTEEPRKLVERREDGELIQKETNPIRVMFYPESFEFPKYHLGLRYNEDWVKETLKFGHKQEQIRLCSVVPGRQALQFSWRDAAIVPGLKVRLPNVKLSQSSLVDEPVVITENVKAIVVGTHPLEKYIYPGTHDGYTEFTVFAYVVTSAKIEFFLYEADRKWHAHLIEEAN